VKCDFVNGLLYTKKLGLDLILYIVNNFELLGSEC
jgi:hypothetical protein